MRTGLVAAVVVAASTLAFAQEPRYENKPLAYWVERFQNAEMLKEQVEAAGAVKAFGADGAPAVPTLLVLLNDRSDRYRGLVAEMLCAIGPGAKEAVPELARRLKDKHASQQGREFDPSKAWELRDVIKILGTIGPGAKEAVPVLAAVMSDPFYADNCLEALCEIGPGAVGALPAIRRVVLGGVNRTTLQALHKLGPDVVPLLLEMIDAPGGEGESIGFGGLKALGPKAAKTAPKLTTLLGHDNPTTRFLAADTLWAVAKDPAVVPVLMRLLNQEPEIAYENDFPRLAPLTAESAAVLLGEIGPAAKDALPGLRDAVALGYALSYFTAAGKPSKAGVAIMPVSAQQYETDLRIYARIRVGQAAKLAIRKITSGSK